MGSHGSAITEDLVARLSRAKVRGSVKVLESNKGENLTMAKYFPLPSLISRQPDVGFRRFLSYPLNKNYGVRNPRVQDFRAPREGKILVIQLSTVVKGVN